MKEIKVDHNQVLSNLHRFQSFLAEQSIYRDQRKERIYPMWVDLQTGVIDFKKKDDLPISTQKELKLIVQESKDGMAHFNIEGDLSSLNLRVQAVAEETIKTLNLLALVLFRTLPEEQAIKDLSHVHLQPWDDQIEKFPGWHSVLQRVDAEKLLQGKPIGTYLIRSGDPITEMLIEQYPPELTGYILTVVEENEKISDYLILKTTKGWALHRDESDLRNYTYLPTFQALLETLKSIAWVPYI